MKALVWLTMTAVVIDAPSATPSPLMAIWTATASIVASLVARTVTVPAAVTVAPSPISAVVVSVITATVTDPPIAEFSAPDRPTVMARMSPVSEAVTETLPVSLSAVESAISAVMVLAM
jgi:hypothetical protein